MGICTQDINALFVEEEIDNTELSAKSMINKLEDVKNYVLTVTKADTSKYKEWDLNTTMIWIKGLDEGRFVKYCEDIRKGFESEAVPSSALPDVVAADLRAEPFNIQSFMDKKKLVQLLKSLKEQHQIAPQMSEMQSQNNINGL